MGLDGTTTGAVKKKYSQLLDRELGNGAPFNLEALLIPDVESTVYSVESTYGNKL